MSEPSVEPERDDVTGEPIESQPEDEPGFKEQFDFDEPGSPGSVGEVDSSAE